SMAMKDDLPSEAMPVEKLLSRQDKFIRFLTNDQVAFLKRLQAQNPLTLYRFGGQVDEEFKTLEGDAQWSAEEWTAWLKPDPKLPIDENLSDEEKASLRKKLELNAVLVNGTNLGDSLLAVLNREGNNMLQGVVVVSDGRSTQFSTQTFEEVKSRAAKAKVPIFTWAMRGHRQPA